MPTLEGNLNIWDEDYKWEEQGDEWSEAWGSASAHWITTLYPRVKDFLPSRRVLEFAPGHGRWTQYLKDMAEELFVVDLSPNCIEHCKKRFKDDTNINYFVNDGKSIPDEIPDESIDFIFCYDSFVHCEIDIMEAYIKEIKRKLKKGGVAFIHHSNLGEYPGYVNFTSKIKKGKRFLERNGILEHIHFRAPSVSAKKIKALVEAEGMYCPLQECFPWIKNKRLIDAITIIQNESPTGKESKLFRNNLHNQEPLIAKSRDQFYQF